jgi:hypothetical protein
MELNSQREETTPDEQAASDCARYRLSPSFVRSRYLEVKLSGLGLKEKRLSHILTIAELPRGSLLHRHDQVFHDVVFAFRGVFAHVEVQDAGGLGFGGVFDLT